MTEENAAPGKTPPDEKPDPSSPNREEAASETYDAPFEKITLVGPSASGKTHLLAALASAGSVVKGMTGDLGSSGSLYGNDPIEWCSFVFERDPNDPESATKINALRALFESILDATGEKGGTERLFRYTVKISHREGLSAAAPKHASWLPGGKGSQESTQQTKPPSTRQVFEVVDGRGGDLTELQYKDIRDEATKNLISDHYSALLEAKGAVICLPWRDKGTVEQSTEVEVADGHVDGLERLIKESNFVDLAKLEYIAVCVTKYELAFMNDGANAYERSIHRETAQMALKDSVYSDLIRALLDFQNERLADKKPKIRVFPCSTFGFVNGCGASNFYPSAKFGGLLTRSIPRKAWLENPELQMHFPQPISNAKASVMWQPFNVGSPFFFAATGKVTGPLCFTLEELQ